jgi:hypothetical protein
MKLNKKTYKQFPTLANRGQREHELRHTQKMHICVIRPLHSASKRNTSASSADVLIPLELQVLKNITPRITIINFYHN